MSALVSYELGGRFSGEGFTGEILWKDTKSIQGVLAYARVKKTGEYVQVFEVGPTEWVDGQPQGWSRGNFETVEDAKKWATKAFFNIKK